MDEFYCSNCGFSIKEDETNCPNCGSDVTYEINELDEQNSVVIKNFNSLLEAETAQEYLLGYGIDSYIIKDDAGGMYPLRLSGYNSIRLIVIESKAVEALRILDSFERGEWNDGDVNFNDEA